MAGITVFAPPLTVVEENINYEKSMFFALTFAANALVDDLLTPTLLACLQD